MTDPQRLHELIQADLDGQLDGAEKAELARLLLSDPAARRLHDEFRSTEALLRGIGQAEPPAGLRSSIQAALGLQDHNRGGRRVVDGGVGFRLAAAVVAGLVVVGLGYGLLHDRSDTSSLQGSVAAAVAPVATLQAGSGRLVVRVEGSGADHARLVLEPSGAASGEVAILPGTGSLSCRSGGDDARFTASADPGSVMALGDGGGPAMLDCAGRGQLQLETRLDGKLQDSATITIGR